MKHIKRISCIFFSILTMFSLAVSTAAASGGERIFTEEDRMIFGLFPIWVFISILAGICMAIVIVLVIIGRARSTHNRKIRNAEKRPQSGSDSE